MTKKAKPDAPYAQKVVASEPKKPHGRPSLRTREIEDEIIERVGRGEFLQRICSAPHMPHDNTVRDWANGDPEFSVRLAQARARGHDEILFDTLDIADDGTGDTVLDKDGNERTNTECVQRAKLRIDTRLRALAILDPSRFGTKVAVESPGLESSLTKATDAVNDFLSALGSK